MSTTERTRGRSHDQEAEEEDERWDQRRGGKGEPQEEPDENWMTKKQRKELATEEEVMRNAAGLDELKKTAQSHAIKKKSAAKGKGAQESAGSGE